MPLMSELFPLATVPMPPIPARRVGVSSNRCRRRIPADSSSPRVWSRNSAADQGDFRIGLFGKG